MKTDPSEIPHTSTSASGPETKTDSCAISLENLSAAKHQATKAKGRQRALLDAPTTTPTARSSLAPPSVSIPPRLCPTPACSIGAPPLKELAVSSPSPSQRPRKDQASREKTTQNGNRTRLLSFAVLRRPVSGSVRRATVGSKLTLIFGSDLGKQAAEPNYS